MNRHETFLPAPTEAEKALGEKAKKDDKPKDKVRTAKKIQKDMEKWAKMLNQKKESQKVAPAAVATPTAGPCPAAPSQKGKDTGNNKNLKSEDQSLNLSFFSQLASSVVDPDPNWIRIQKLCGLNIGENS